MADQKQHAKITPEICRLRDRFDASKTVREKTQLLADAMRDARLDEAKMFVSEMERCRSNSDRPVYLTNAIDAGHRYIAALQRGEA